MMNAIPQTVPYIYTKNGNVPEASLTYSKQWKIDDELIIFTEMWHDTTGELVKNNVHMYALKGIPESTAHAATL